MDLFDLTSRPNLISPAHAFDFTFVAIGLGLIGAVLYLCRRQGWRALFYLPVAMGWTAAAGWMTWHDIHHAHDVRTLVQNGRFARVEGCLDQFHPGLASPSESNSGLERWNVAGREFYYGADEIRLGYHRVESGGGLVHADSWVRVGFVHDEVRGHNDIVRLEVKQRACPSAPNLWPD